MIEAFECTGHMDLRVGRSLEKVKIASSQNQNDMIAVDREDISHQIASFDVSDDQHIYLSTQATRSLNAESIYSMNAQLYPKGATPPYKLFSVGKDGMLHAER